MSSFAAMSLRSALHATSEPERASDAPSMSFDAAFRAEYDARFESLARYLARLTGDPAAAADIAQEAFVRLYLRGSMPQDARAWVVSVAHNLLRNERQQIQRRLQLLERHRPDVPAPGRGQHADERIETEERRAFVQRALDRLPERERQLLLLRHEGFSYREIAQAVDMHEASVGTLLARAKSAFRQALGRAATAPEAIDA
jgi:RNA polymerase sigma factor (sigma-70 family)